MFTCMLIFGKGSSLRHQKTLARVMCKLVGRLQTKPLLDYLLSQTVISWEDYDSLRRQHKNASEQSRDLISLLSRKGSRGFSALCTFLEKNNDLYEGIHRTLLDIHDSITEGTFMFPSTHLATVTHPDLQVLAKIITIWIKIFLG